MFCATRWSAEHEAGQLMQLLCVPERSGRSRRAGSSQQPAPPVFSQDSDTSSAAEQEARGSGSLAAIAAALRALKDKDRDENKQGELLAKLVTAGVAFHHGGEKEGCALCAHWLGSGALCSHTLPYIQGGLCTIPSIVG
jgi:hypothetical protein